MITNEDMKLPLALFIESGKGQYSGNIQRLIQAAPDSISELDRKTLLYPFMLALCSERSSISVANDLLRMDPSLVGNNTSVSYVSRKD